MLENTLLPSQFFKLLTLLFTAFSNCSVCPWYGSQSISQAYQCKPSNEA